VSADRLTPGHRATDHRRAALALIAALADGDGQAVDALLGRGWQRNRRAAIAVTLARWHVTGMRRLGWDDPAWIARENIAWTISDEAEGAGP
jgi:hypothetical protein